MARATAGIKLLLVDDESDFREAARQALSRQGFQVSEAESGERALEMLASQRPDLVVLDLKMRGMGGVAALRAIRELDEDLPVMILTGHGRYEDALAGIQLGVVDFVQKPVDMKQMASRIRGILAVAAVAKPLGERSIKELMVPQSLYSRIYADQTVREAVDVLRRVQLRALADEDTDRGRRTLLVFDRKQRFVGLLRAEDVVRVIVPEWLESSHASYLTGMFLAQAKVVGGLLLQQVVLPPVSVEIDAPLMEAAHLIVSRRVSHLAVMRKGKLVGVLRPEDLYQELVAPFV
jgi:DNA-binding response OmpR family regulator